MRRIVSALLCLLFLAMLTPQASDAQFTLVGPGGVLFYSTASVTCGNNTTACSVASYTISPAYVATSSTTNPGSVPIAQGNPLVSPPVGNASGPNVNTAIPLHLVMRGTMTLNSPGQIGPINVGVNYGGSTATIALVNGHTPVSTAQFGTLPVQLDVWLAPLATGIGVNTVTLMGRMSYISAGATETSFNAYVIGTTPVNVSNVLTVQWQWASGSTTNSVQFHNTQLLIGN